MSNAANIFTLQNEQRFNNFDEIYIKPGISCKNEKKNISLTRDEVLTNEMMVRTYWCGCNNFFLEL